MAETTVCFHRTLHPKNLGTCLSEILKYILYAKGQIPLPYNQLVKEKTMEELNDRKSSRQAKRFWERVKKLQQCLSCIHSMCSEAGPSIQEMVVILGGTLVSPKEVYQVKIEAGLVNNDTSELSQDNLTRYVVKNLVSIGLEADPQTLSLTNCFVLLLAPRLAKFDTHAFPRMSFKVLQRGSHVCLHLNLEGSCKDDTAMQHLGQTVSVKSGTELEGAADGPLAGDVQEQGMSRADGPLAGDVQEQGMSRADGPLAGDVQEQGMSRADGPLAGDMQEQGMSRADGPLTGDVQEQGMSRADCPLTGDVQEQCMSRADCPLTGDVQEQCVREEEAEAKVKEDLVHLLAGLSLDESEKDDYVWFQIAAVFQGFKELPLPSNSREDWSDANDIWARSS